MNEFILNRKIFQVNEDAPIHEVMILKCAPEGHESLNWAREAYHFCACRGCDLSKCMARRGTVAAYSVLDETARPVAKHVWRRRIWYVTSNDLVRQQHGIPPAAAVKFASIHPDIESEPAEWPVWMRVAP